MEPRQRSLGTRFRVIPGAAYFSTAAHAPYTLRAGTGQSPEKPIGGLDVRLAHALLRVFRLRFIGQSARFEGDTVLDRLECRDAFLDDPVVLWFRVPAPEVDDEMMEADLAELMASLDEESDK